VRKAYFEKLADATTPPLTLLLFVYNHAYDACIIYLLFISILPIFADKKIGKIEINNKEGYGQVKW
jgi:hypothetical protein